MSGGHTPNARVRLMLAGRLWPDRPCNRACARRSTSPGAEMGPPMRSSALHAALHAYADEAATLLRHERDAGDELPFDVVESGGARMGRTPLYCYRPMTAEFIRDRGTWLSMLPAHGLAVQELEEMDGLDRYLLARGARSVARAQSDRAEAVLAGLIADLFDETAAFEIVPERFERAYEALETAVFAGESQIEIVAVVRGIELESSQVALSDGLSLLSLEALDDAPEELAGPEPAESIVLARWIELRPEGDGGPPARAPAWAARMLTPLRLYVDGEVGVDPIGWIRHDGGAWCALDLGAGRAPRAAPVAIAATAEDELRGFCNLIGRRLPRGGEVAWALSRYEMACERRLASEALTDHLLALRALLEPEGPASGHLAGRLAALCAVPTRRRELAERIAHAVSLERAVIAGLGRDSESGLEAIVDELAGHLRALLRDVLCGHLDSDLRGVADELIDQESERDADEPDADGTEPGRLEDDGFDRAWPVAGELEFVTR
jgi:hypothetical protein